MDTLNHSHLTVSMAKGSPWWPIPTVLTHSVACPACTPEHTGGIEHGPLGQVWSNRKDGMWSQIVVPQASQKSASHCVRGGPWGWATRDVLERHGGKDGGEGWDPAKWSSIFGLQEMHGVERTANRGSGGLEWGTSILAKGLGLWAITSHPWDSVSSYM